MCAYCGRKRKSNELVMDDEFARGLWCCPQHRDLRHPQEFARGIKEDMQVPKTQPPMVTFVQINTGFPLKISPSPVILNAVVDDLITETTGQVITTESGNDIAVDSSFSGLAYAVLPPWIAPVFAGEPDIVYVQSYDWTWASGGVGLDIASPNTLSTNIFSNAAFIDPSGGGLVGVLQLEVIDSLEQLSIATVQVITTS